VSNQYFCLMISVSIIGAGNVATHLYKACKAAEGISINQWYSRDVSKLSSYQNEVQTISDVASLSEADIYIIAISDDSISEFSSSLPFEGRLVVHTSGSVNIHDLDKKHRRGVLYPLQTFSKGANITIQEVPFCIEALEKSDYKLLKALVEALGAKAYKISTEQRQTLHLSAVFVNNFVNQLYRIAHEISDAKSIDFNILKPLIMETAQKVQEMSPYKAQTGPAMRRDKKTIKRHLKLLEKEEHKTIYKLLTASIQNTHGR